MNIDTAGIEAIVKRVMTSIDAANGVAPAAQDAKGKDGIFEDMEDAIAAAQAAKLLTKSARPLRRKKPLKPLSTWLLKKPAWAMLKTN